MDIPIKIFILALAIAGVMSCVEGSTIPSCQFAINNSAIIKIVQMKEKICSKCGEVKLLSEFRKREYPRGGIRSECKSCEKNRSAEYGKSKDGVLSTFYSSQRYNSKPRGHKPPTYTRDELKDWCFSQKLFHELYDNWKANGFSTELKPSCDRLNDYKGYSLDNLRLVTWRENRERLYRDMVNGINNKRSRAVVGENVTTGEVFEFYSMAEAARKTRAIRAHITSCCSNKRKSAGGFVWKYKTQ